MEIKVQIRTDRDTLEVTREFDEVVVKNVRAETVVNRTTPPVRAWRALARDIASYLIMVHGDPDDEED